MIIILYSFLPAVAKDRQEFKHIKFQRKSEKTKNDKYWNKTRTAVFGICSFEQFMTEKTLFELVQKPNYRTFWVEVKTIFHYKQNGDVEIRKGLWELWGYLSRQGYFLYGNNLALCTYNKLQKFYLLRNYKSC